MDNDPTKKQTATTLQKQVAELTIKVARLEEENKSLKFLVDNQRSPVKQHIKVRLRKNGEQWQKWGVIGQVVRKSQHLTCREIVNLTGFERCAVYAAARRLGIKLRSPHPKV